MSHYYASRAENRLTFPLAISRERYAYCTQYLRPQEVAVMTRTWILAIGLTLSVLAAIFLTTKSTASPPGVEGTIVTVNAASQSIRIVDDDAEYWFTCTPETKFTLNGYAASFNQ